MKQKSDDSNDSAGQPAAATTGEPVAEPAGPGPGSAPVDANGEPVREARGAFSFLVGWVALMLSLVALAASGYLAWQSRDTGRNAAGNEAAIASLSEGIGDARSSLENLKASLSELGETDRESAAEIGMLKRQLNDSARQHESVALRLGNLENAIASLQGVSAGVRDTWMLAEAEYYMQIANAQLQLAGNPESAALALGFADERIRQLANPALSDVRRALTGELQALESMEKPDLQGITLSLASLADRVESLPLNENVDTPREALAPLDPELRGFARAVASMKRAFSDVVSVRRTDEALTPLLSPDAAYFLRANLALKLQAARLALLKGEQGVFEQCLDDAAAWLGEYYDADSRAVASALETIAELKAGLKDGGVSVSPPDISESLRLLRQYRTQRDAESPDNPGVSGNTGGSPAEPEQ
jgi:uroporphyrin-3 C-methyltransferase